MTSRAERIQLLMLQNTPVLLFGVLFATFGLIRSEFVSAATLEIVATQAAITGVLAVGMTFVLLTAGIDLSVGSTMYLCAVAIGGLLGGRGAIAALLLCLLVGTLFGVVNALFITRFRVVAFVVTLATLYVGRGIGESISNSEQVRFPEPVIALASARLTTPLWDVPVSVIVFAVVVAAGHVLLTRTAFGRHVYAVGENAETAQKAGIGVNGVLLRVYVLSGVCAGLAALVAAAQQGVAAPGFGSGKEFDAIAAAVLGGTSLFGGRGSILPGTVVGAFLIGMVAHGVVFVGLDIYLQPMVTAGVIFLAVFLDSVRSARVRALQRRRIRIAAPRAPAPVGGSVGP